MSKGINKISDLIELVSEENLIKNLDKNFKNANYWTQIEDTYIWKILDFPDHIMIVSRGYNFYKVRDWDTLNRRIKELRTLNGIIVPNCLKFTKFENSNRIVFGFAGPKYDTDYADIYFQLNDITELDKFINSLVKVYELANSIQCYQS